MSHLKVGKSRHIFTKKLDGNYGIYTPLCTQGTSPDFCSRKAAGVGQQDGGHVAKTLLQCNIMLTPENPLLKLTGSKRQHEIPYKKSTRSHLLSISLRKHHVSALGPAFAASQAPGGIQHAWVSSAKHQVLQQQQVPFPRAKILQLRAEREMSLRYLHVRRREPMAKDS